MNESIHPTAIVNPEARLGEGTQVGPYAIIESHVRIGARCTIMGHAMIRARTTVGDDVTIHPFAVLGGEPQHMRDAGATATVEIGSRTTIREYVTVHRGTSLGIGRTVVGEDVLLMAYSHVGHDACVGARSILANSVHLGGHVEIGRSVMIGGVSAIPQFLRVGDFCFLGSGSMLRKDLPPFMSGKGAEFRVQGVNLVGLQRGGISPEAIRILRSAFKIVYMKGLTLEAAIQKLQTDLEQCPELHQLIEFLQQAKKGIER